MKFIIPPTLKAEHSDLHAALAKAMATQGRTGEAARAVAHALHPHFVKEEVYALPPLDLLPSLAAGELTPEMSAVLTMIDKLEADLAEMLFEHRAIIAALERLIDVAEAERNPQIASLAKRLIAHAQTEEEVLYPTALLIGRFVRNAIDIGHPKAQGRH